MASQSSAGAASKRAVRVDNMDPFRMDAVLQELREALKPPAVDIRSMIRACWPTVSEAIRRGESPEMVAKVLAGIVERHCGKGSIGIEAAHREILARQELLRARSAANARSRATLAKRKNGSAEQAPAANSPIKASQILDGDVAEIPEAAAAQVAAPRQDSSPYERDTLFSSVPTPPPSELPSFGKRGFSENIRDQLPPAWVSQIRGKPKDPTAKVGVIFDPNIDSSFVNEHGGTVKSSKGGDREASFWMEQADLVEFATKGSARGLTPRRIVYAGSSSSG